MKTSPSASISHSSFTRRWLAPLALSLGALCATHAAEPAPLGCFISTGDNHWLGESLPIDSPAAIEDSFALLARLGVRTVYWRGLEEATWMETMTVREENCRYASAFRWMQQLYRDVHPDRLAVAAAHRHGMEIWGCGTLVDWQGPGDTPNFNDFPNGFESRLRLDHPEWVPVDRSGLLKQSGPVDFAYPEARRALVNLHMKFVRQDGYDGVMFVTYAENYGMRFQDEFGFNEPIVKEFKRRTGVDLLTQPFTRAASRFDWYALRGESLTQYFRELKAELRKDGKKLSIMVNPFEPRFTQPWNVPEIMLTAGHIYVDLETYVREGLMDRLVVWGYSSAQMQNRAVDDCLWLTRDTPCSVGALTSSPFADRWKPYREKGASIVMSLGDDASYLDRSEIPPQPISALGAEDPVLRMRVLAQIISGKLPATAEQVAPLTHDRNVIVRRLALSALGKLKDPAAVPIIEQRLEDEENAVRCAAALALRDNNRPESAAKMLEAVDRHGTHSLVEMVFHTMPRIEPKPRAVLAEATKHANPLVRSTAMRSLVFMADPSLLPTFAAGLHDADRFTRFAAAEALGNVRHSPEAVELLLEALKHEDPTVSDRAATSLAVIIAGHTAETEPLRPRIVAGLGELYGKLGDGCQRSDAQWGYRPVGNALLKMGPEGERVLQGFMDQHNDRQLALEAWKTLWIRQDTKTFSEVTEKENDESFRHLPAWLRPGAAVTPVSNPTAPAAPAPAAPAAKAEAGRQWYVNPNTGDDAHDGLAAEVSGNAGPLKTIARAVRLSGPGDTIHLAKCVFHEQVRFAGTKSGESGKPITVDGHDAVIDGCFPLDESQWVKVGPGLYRNDTIFKTILQSKWEFVDRFSFVFDGKLVRMNHSVKAPKVAWKAPADLQVGEWTYQKDDNNAYYIKIDPARTLADYHISLPTMVSGVQIDGNISHLVFRNITVTHVVNDGFALRTSPAGAKVRDILYQNIRTTEACDDGFSAHDDCEVRVENFLADGCSTGIATSGKSYNDHVVTRNIHGVDLLFLQGEHTVANSRIEAHGGSAAVSVSTFSQTPGMDTCSLTLDNVVVDGPADGASKANRMEVRGAKSRLELRHASLENMSIMAAAGGALTLTDCSIRGETPFTISLSANSPWNADGNQYGSGTIRIGTTDYSTKDFAAYQKATGQDGSSHFVLEVEKPATGDALLKPAFGADRSRIP